MWEPRPGCGSRAPVPAPAGACGLQQDRSIRGRKGAPVFILRLIIAADSLPTSLGIMTEVGYAVYRYGLSFGSEIPELFQ